MHKINIEDIIISQSQIIISSPLEQFEVVPLISFNGISSSIFTLTNHGLYTIICLFIILGFHYITKNNNNLIPSK